MDDSMHALSKVHPRWLQLFPEDFARAEGILRTITNYQPESKSVFRVFELSPDEVKVVIVGQDPYPTAGDATGVAFEVARDIKLPKSLQNIFKELQSDTGKVRTSGNLSDWQLQGVFLINRILTTPTGKPLGHSNIGWEEFTEKIISYLGGKGTVALLMGNRAQEMGKYFVKKVEVAHPSPLSAYRGFFGSKPFSRINALLDMSLEPINW